MPGLLRTDPYHTDNYKLCKITLTHQEYSYILLFRSHDSDSSGGFLQLNPDESDFSREASCLTLQPVFSTQEPLQKDASPQQKILRQLGKVLPGDWRSTPLGESFSIHLNH